MCPLEPQGPHFLSCLSPHPRGRCLMGHVQRPQAGSALLPLSPGPSLVQPSVSQGGSETPCAVGTAQVTGPVKGGPARAQPQKGLGPLCSSWLPRAHAQRPWLCPVALPRGLRLRPHALQFVKVPSSVAPSVLFDLLLDEWHLPPPNLVVSLVGVEQPFAMKSWLRDVLRKGLVKAVESTGEAPSWSRALGTPQPPEHGAPQPLTLRASLDGGP